MQSELWGILDPAAEFRVAPIGYADGGSDPSRQSVAKQTAWYSPESGNFGFLVVATGIFAGLFYVFEHGGAGAGAKAHLGPASGDANLEVGK